VASEGGRSNVQGALFALGAMAVYASHDAIIKHLGTLYSSFQILFFAILFSFPLITIVIMHDKTEANLRPKYLGWTVIRTACTIVVGISAFYAFTALPLAETYSIVFMTPIFITILSIPLLGERVGLHRWMAIITGLVGVIVVFEPWSSRAELSLGHLAALAAAAFSSLAAVIVRKVGKEERAAVLMLYPMVANFLVLGAILPFVYKPITIEDMGYSAGMACLGVTGGLLFIQAYRRGEAVIVAPMQYSQILWATFYGMIFFGERPQSNVLLGAGIIIASGLYIVLRESGGKVSENSPVLTTMDMARDKAAPRPSLVERLSGK
jgi:S-adenosylmethionine uptake transporter